MEDYNSNPFKNKDIDRLTRSQDKIIKKYSRKRDRIDNNLKKKYKKADELGMKAVGAYYAFQDDAKAKIDKKRDKLDKRIHKKYVKRETFNKMVGAAKEQKNMENYPYYIYNQDK